jgi:flagellar hook-associated protein 1 FlgK
MGLTSSLLIGRTALTASQVALQVTGNNIANAATVGYHRQRVGLSPLPGQSMGQNIFAGRGVAISEIRRVVDPALSARVRSSLADEQAAQVEVSILNTLESLTNELTGIDLSTELGRFFNAFSELANNPAGTATRATVIERGVSLASYVRSLRSDMIEARQQLESQLMTNVNRADELLGNIASLNGAIVTAELGRGEEGSLRDQRELLITELSELMDVAVVEQSSGAVDILVDSVPVVQGQVSRGLERRSTTWTRWRAS